MYKLRDDNHEKFPGWYCKAPTITELMDTAIKDHINCPNPDAVLNIETHLFNVCLHSSSCQYDLDLGKQVWLMKGRWSRLIREYVPKDPLERFTEQCKEILMGEARDGATANLMFRDPERFDKKHRWGGCLMSATFRGSGHHRSGKPCLTFFSRTTYMGYMALLDAAIGSVMAREIVKQCRGVWKGKGYLTVNDIQFRWYISSQQLHNFKSLPYIFSDDTLMDQLEKYYRQKRKGELDRENMSPTWYHLTQWYFKVVEGWKEAKKQGMTPKEWLSRELYGPFKRIKRRWLESTKVITDHIPPSLPISKLDFSKAE